MTVDATSPPLLSVRDLHTHFPQEEGTVKAVDGVSFDLYPGRTLGIVGESGCGKSMTARSILRILDRPGRIVAGEILFRRRQAPGASTSAMVDLTQLDANSGDMRAIRGAEIALVFQEPMSSFSPVHTIGNQIVEAIRLHQKVSRRQARERAIDVFRHVGIPLPEQRLDAYSHQLSGGLRQRAMIAMALVCNPSLLIADEPTTALDVTTQAQILDLLRHLQAEYGMAIMLITHDLGVIAEIADDVVVMYLDGLSSTPRWTSSSTPPNIPTHKPCCARFRICVRVRVSPWRLLPGACRIPTTARPDVRFTRAASRSWRTSATGRRQACCRSANNTTSAVCCTTGRARDARRGTMRRHT